MYVVKVGEYYVSENLSYNFEIRLSREIMRAFNDKRFAEILAKRLNGEVIEMKSEVDNGAK